MPPGRTAHDAMKTLDRYIIRQFLINFVIALAVFLLMTTLIDVLVELDEYLEAGRMRADRHGGSVAWWTIVSIINFNVPVLMMMYTVFSGLVVIAAVGFTFKDLSQSRELVAMLTSGISMYRIAAPVLVVGILINLTSLPIKEFAIPRVSHQLLRSKGDMAMDTVKTHRVYYATDGQGNLISALSFDAEGQRLEGVVVLTRGETGAARGHIMADAATWNGDRGGWTLSGAQMLGGQLDRQQGSDDGSSNGTKNFFLLSDLSPDVLLTRQTAKYIRMLSLNDLSRLLLADSAQQYRAQVLASMHSRFSVPAVNVLILVMALPFFMLREPASPTMQAVKATVLCFAAWITGVMLQQTGVSLMNPVTAVWLPVVIYLPIAAVLVQRTKT